jgi:uncharacterized protein (DUF3084 family)
MGTQGDHELPATETIRQLQAENQALQAKMTQLQAAHQATLQGLEKRLAVEKEHEASFVSRPSSNSPS